MSYIEMPYPLPVNSKKFDLAGVQELTPAGQGFIQTIDRVRPMWVAEYSTPPLRDARYNEMQAFLDELDGSGGTFLAYDPRRPMPYAYRHHLTGTTPWGDANITAASHSNSTLSVQFSVGNITLTKGDYIAYVYGTAWYLHRLIETKNTGPGGFASFKVRPRPQTFSGTFYARLALACAEMKLLGKPEWNDSVDTLPSVSFNAVQFLNRVPA